MWKYEQRNDLLNILHVLVRRLHKFDYDDDDHNSFVVSTAFIKMITDFK